MDEILKEKIKRRGLEMLHITQRILLEDESSFEIGEAYKFAFLLLRRPRKYLETFEVGELEIDVKAVAEVYWHYGGELSYSPGILYEERLIIAQHNEAVAKLRKQTHRPTFAVAVQ